MSSDPFDENGICKRCGTWKSHDRDCPHHKTNGGVSSL